MFVFDNKMNTLILRDISVKRQQNKISQGRIFFQ